jgi:uncharacterized membrane protein YhaH (DUF805 family)
MNQSINPYQAPLSDVSTAAIDSDAVKLTTQQIYFSFEGRLSRKPYWLYALGMGLIAMVAFSLIMWLLPMILAMVIMGLGYIALIWATFALQAKRWHDRNKSGWWILISFIPVIGAIWALVENGFLRGTDGANNYGADATDLY